MLATLPSSEASTTEQEPDLEENSNSTRGTYGQILKSSAVVGGSQVLNIALGIVRIKVMATLLGPSGFGLFGVYASIADLTQTIAGMGVSTSGVRQIAEASASNNLERIGHTVAVLRITSIILGLLGAILLVLFANQVSLLTFGNNRHATAISLLSIAVFLKLVSAGQGALIQGMRRIADLARISVLGAFSGILISIPVVYVFRESGIVPSLIGVAAMTTCASWWYSRKVHVRMPLIAWSQMRRDSAPLLKLGFAFMITGLMTMGSAYVVRIIVLRKLGIEATGLYQSAWTLGGLYLSFILQAMAADFYPRLAGIANDNVGCNRMVNEQTLVGLLLAGPGTIITLTFAPAVLSMFYSVKFVAAVGILRWICLGTTLQVITWPIGFIMLAKGKSSIFLLSDLAWTAVYLGLASLCVHWFGLNGTGMAFFGSYVFHVLLSFPVARWLTGFRWSRENGRTALLFLSVITLVFLGFALLPPFWATGLGSLASIAVSLYSIRTLCQVLGPDQIPSPLRPLLAGLSGRLCAFHKL